MHSKKSHFFQACSQIIVYIIHSLILCIAINHNKPWNHIPCNIMLKNVCASIKALHLEYTSMRVTHVKILLKSNFYYVPMELLLLFPINKTHTCLYDTHIGGLSKYAKIGVIDDTFQLIPWCIWHCYHPNSHPLR